MNNTLIKKLHILLSLLMALCMLLSPASFCFAKDDVFEINGVADFMEFTDHCRLNSWSKNKTVRLNCDIDLAGYGFTGIPSFSGTFEGNNHTVKNYTLENESDISGLFIYIEKDGLVKDLSVYGDIKSSSKSYTGGLCAVNAGTIEGCSFYGDLVSSGLCGGIAGSNGSGGVIRSCSNYADIVSLENIGGIAGDNRGLIISCINEGAVNSTGSWVDESKKISLSDLSAYSIDFDSGSNIGGIAGTNSGSIEACTNNATVGYMKSGRNIGGIAGFSEGHILSCVNNGSIFGRSNVAGIAGHMQPYIVEDTTENMRPTINTLHDQTSGLINDISATGDVLNADIDELTDNVDKMTDTANSISQELTSVVNNDSDAINDEADALDNAGSSINSSIKKANAAASEINKVINDDASYTTVAGIRVMTADAASKISSSAISLTKAIDELAGAIETLRKESSDFELDTFSPSFKRNLNRLDSQVHDVDESLDKLSSDLVSYTNAVEDDAHAINDTTNTLLNLALDNYEKLEEMLKGEDHFSDLSASNPNYKNASTIKKSVNYGPVKGQSNVGGVAGDSDIELSDSIKSDTVNIGKSYFVYAVIDGCSSSGYVSAGKANAGGIAGYNNYGLITGCLASGVIDSSGADYVGGIAGLSYAYIKNSSSLAVLNGAKYVGGIAGDGNEIKNCLSLAEINSFASAAGAIAGSDLNHKDSDITQYRSYMAKRISGNYYCSEDFYGIDGASYVGVAEALSYEDICRLKNAPEEFKNLKIIFYDPEGFIIKEDDVYYGELLDSIDYPLTSVGKEYIGWSSLKSPVVSGNVVLLAETRDSIRILPSVQKNTEGKPLAFAEGEFTDFTILDVTEQSSEDGLPAGENDTAACYTLSIENGGIGEDDETRMRIYCGDAEEPLLYIKTGSNWQLLETTHIGHYIGFTMTGSSAEVCIVNSAGLLPGSGLLIPLVIIAVIVAAVAIIVIHKKKAKKKDENIGDTKEQ